MSESQPDSGISWTKVAARGLKARVPAPIRKIDKDGNREVFTTRVLFETPAIAAYNRSKQVTSIIQTALSSKAVVFDFPGSIFSNRIEAYKLILEKIGPVVGNAFNPISHRGTRSSGNLIISTEFRDPANRLKAIQQGVTVNHLQFKATPFKDTASSSNDIIRVNLTLNVHHEVDTMCDKLVNSFRHYGKVVQVKQLLYHNLFEGEFSVLLDRSSSGENGPEYQELTRMLYLEDWDDHVPASFKGAQPVCYYCRKSGHIKADCPTLNKMKCFRCNKTGHTKRRCTATAEDDDYELSDYNFEEEVKEYLQVSSTLTPPATKNLSINKMDEDKIKEITSNSKDQVDLKDKIRESVDYCIDESNDAMEEDALDNELDEDTSMMDSEKPRHKVAPFTEGIAASKHAPVAIRTTMDVDTVVSEDNSTHTNNTLDETSSNKQIDTSKPSKSATSLIKPTKTNRITRKGHE